MQNKENTSGCKKMFFVRKTSSLTPSLSFLFITVIDFSLLMTKQRVVSYLEGIIKIYDERIQTIQKEEVGDKDYREIVIICLETANRSFEYILEQLKPTKKTSKIND